MGSIEKSIRMHNGVITHGITPSELSVILAEHGNTKLLENSTFSKVKKMFKNGVIYYQKSDILKLINDI